MRYKYAKFMMDNHYGARVFGNCRCKIPMNIQLFAEGSGDGGGESGEGAGGAGTDGGDGDTGDGDTSSGNTTPTVEELLAQLAEERAKGEKLKIATDKATRNAAEYKRQLGEKMSAQEKAEAAQKEAYEAMQNELAELKRDKLISTYTEQCMDENIAMNKETARAFSEAIANQDAEKVFSSLGKHISALKKSWTEEFYKSNPQLNAGNGSGADNPGSDFVRRRVEAAKNSVAAQGDILKQFM